MWGKQSTFDNLQIRLRTADPEDGCDPYNFNHPKHETAYLVSGAKDCPLSNILHNAQTHGAKAVFIVNDKDTELDRIVLPDHMSGVHIHVFVITKSVGEALLAVTRQAKDEDENWHTRSMIEIDFVGAAARQKAVSIKMTYSPDQLPAAKFLADLYESPFADNIDKGIDLELHYTFLHCDQCKKDGYKHQKTDCLSGGRYCWKSDPDSGHIGGEVMLIQMVKNMCVETMLSIKERRKEIGNYYWLYYHNCIHDFQPECTNAILDHLGILDDVFKCVTTSFYKNVKKSDSMMELKHPNIYLEHNYLLGSEKRELESIKHYAHFPLLKINDIVYYGPITFSSVMGFICKHINDDYKGCEQFHTEEDVETQAFHRKLEMGFIGFTFLAVLLGVFICRKRLIKKFNSELAFKVEESIKEYLQKKKDSEGTETTETSEKSEAEP